MSTTSTSIWVALRNPVFFKLWLASVVSGCCVSAHDMAATWVMNTMTPSPFFLSLLSTAASLPFFLFTFPAGALADMLNRKKLLLRHACLAGRGSCRTCLTRIAQTAESFRHPDCSIPPGNRVCLQCAGLDIRDSGRGEQGGTAFGRHTRRCADEYFRGDRAGTGRLASSGHRVECRFRGQRRRFFSGPGRDPELAQSAQAIKSARPRVCSSRSWAPYVTSATAVESRSC